MITSIHTIKPTPWMTDLGTIAVLEALGGPKKALFVGGCVRNTILGLPSGDIDIATVLTPDQTQAKLTAAGLKAIPTGIEHGTITAVSEGKNYEITTLRKDVETDGRRAVVAFTKDWGEDAQRRDFTMNTLLADTEGHIYDPLGAGFDDLKAGRVVFVGDPAQRIAEDYLRILRFFRFFAFYGRGAPDAAALEACREAAQKIGRLSKERVTQETLKILSVDDVADILNLMFKNNVLNDCFENPDLGVIQNMSALQQAHEMPDVIARFAAANGVVDKFSFSNRDKKHVADVTAAADGLTALSDKAVKALIYKYGPGVAGQAALLHAARHDGDMAAAAELVRTWLAPALPVTGNDVKAAGISSGPAIGTALDQLEQWWIANDFEPGRDACLKQLTKIVSA